MSLVWIETPTIKAGESKEVAFLPAIAISSDDKTMEVKLEQSGEGWKKGEVKRVPLSETRARFQRGDKCTAVDNTSLVHMNDASILDNLYARHAQDQIYTYTASVLLAVNPYKTIDGLYGDAQCSLYQGKHLGALPPHPYAIADTCYRTMVREKANQALLISGESGAGKTETAKIVMQYLAYASKAASDLAGKIQARVLNAQPILESFGNSVTLRNSNSSRFGKYNRVYFDAHGTLVDAGIQTYLLESSRVVVHGERERTYHVFYEMIQGLSDERLKAFHLDKSKEYRMLHNAGKSATGFEARDKGNFDRLVSALETVGQNEDAINQCLQVLAGLVHLGDIPKEDAEVDMAARKDSDVDSDTRTVEVNEESVNYAAELLGIDPDELGGVLKRKRIAIPGRDSMHEVPRSPLQFRQALHSMIKALYKRMFELTVRRINDSFKELRPEQAEAEMDNWRNIGILDIYGFERLQRNSFEQLCINLANERLQKCFVENVLVAEQQLYCREGLPWTGLTLPDSEPVLNCIGSVFKTLDDFSSRQAKGFGEAQQVSDDRFCEKVLKECSADPMRKDILKAVKVSAKDARSGTGCRANEFFVVTHYAGAVDYSTKGWLDKNNDRLLLECEALILDSSVPLVASLGDSDTKQTFRSISAKYTKDLEALLSTLGESSLHYIRCFKPNGIQKAGIWNGCLVLDQIVQCGTIELVKIMHDGFPNRVCFEELVARFKALLPEKFQRYGTRTFVEALMMAYEVPRQEWALGMSRLFLKAGQLKALEDMRSEGAVPDTAVLERVVKQIIRKRWSRAIVAVKLCNWLPKFLRQVYIQKAATTLSAVAVVAGRIAPRLEAAKKRVLERRQAMRRKLGGVFRTVHCMNNAWRQIREQRKERAVKALYLASFIVTRMKPAIASARSYIQEAEVRRAREEERLRAEMEKKLREEEEQLRLQAEIRRQEEEERLRVQAEKRQQEEEERLAAEAEKRKQEEEAAEKRREEEEAERLRLEVDRAAELEREEAERKQKAEEEKLEQDRLREEAAAEMEAIKKKQTEDLEEMKRSMQEEMKATMAAEMQAAQATMAAEMKRLADENDEERRKETERREAQDKSLEDERLQLAQERQEVAATVRRLSVAQSAANSSSVDNRFADEDRPAGDDDQTDIGDSVSVAYNPNRGAGARDVDIQAMVKEQSSKEFQRLFEELQQSQNKVKDEMRALQEKNQRLEQEVQRKNETDEVRSQVSALELSPNGNMTPLREERSAPSPLSGLSGASPQASTQEKLKTKGSAERGARKYSILDNNISSQRLSTTPLSGGMKQRRLSVAEMKETMVGLYNPEGTDSAAKSRASVGGEPVQGQGNQNRQRKWWAEQRAFLMEDLYQVGGTPTPSRNNRSSKRLSQDGAPSSMVSEKPLARGLEDVFDDAAQEKNAANVEWVCDAASKAGPEVCDAASKSKLKAPQVYSKNKSGYTWKQGNK